MQFFSIACQFKLQINQSHASNLVGFSIKKGVKDDKVQTKKQSREEFELKGIWIWTPI